jgi:O-antigen/teichoic acid export membrane protein
LTVAHHQEPGAGENRDRAPAGPTSKITGFRLVTNAATSTIAYAIYLPVSLLVSAYTVHRIGLTAFGVWATLTTIMGYGELFDLGVTAPLVKYVAENNVHGNHREVNALLGTAMVVYLAAGTVFVAGMLLAGGWILTHFFHVSAGDSTIYTLFVAVVVGFAVSIVFSVVQSLIVGLQRADLVSRLLLGYNLAGAVATVIVLKMGLGVNGLVLVWLGTTLLQIAGNLIVARRLFPALQLNPFLFSFFRLRQIMRFSTRIQLSSIAFAVNDQLDRTLIAYVLGPTLLASYALASRAAQSLRGISYSLASGLLPAAADISALGDSDRLRQLYLRATRYLAIADFGMCVCVAALARPLVNAWLGPGHDRVALTLIIILASYTIALPCHATSEALNGMGRPDIRLRADLTLLPVHLALGIILIWQFGYFGTLVGTALIYAGNRTYLYWAGARAVNVPPLELVRRSLLSPAIAALLALGVAVAIQAAGAPLTIPVLIGEVAVFALVYFGYLGLFSLDHYERQLLAEHVSPLLRRGRQALRPHRG